jgi:uncharacterized surface protein with fasciclin (FAS1) repeats
MNRIITPLFLSAALVLTMASCNNNEAASVETTPAKEEASQAEGITSNRPDFTPEELTARAERKRKIQEESERLKAENPVLATEYNTTSIYKYVTTAPEFSIFAKLLMASDMAKTCHNTNMTVFVPNDAAFANVDQGVFHLLFKPSKKDALNKFINNHICQPKVGAEKIGSATGLSDGNGNAFKVNNEGILSINGVEAVKHDINTNNGNIIQVRLPIGFPTSL